MFLKQISSMSQKYLRHTSVLSQIYLKYNTIPHTWFTHLCTTLVLVFYTNTRGARKKIPLPTRAIVLILFKNIMMFMSDYMTKQDKKNSKLKLRQNRLKLERYSVTYKKHLLFNLKVPLYSND